MLDAIPAHTSLVHHYFYFSQHFTAERSDPLLPTLARLMFFPRSSIDIVIVISGFCQEMEPRYSRDCEAGPDRNVKITSSDVKIYILFSLNGIYNNTLPPSGWWNYHKK